MNIGSIKNGIAGLPKQALNGVNAVGSTTIKAEQSAVKFVADHAKNLTKSKETPAWISNIKNAIKNIQVPEFAKPAVNFLKSHKETVVGAAVITAAVACATAIVKSVVGKINEAKSDKNTKSVH